MISQVFVIIGYFCLTQSQTRFMPNLPLGEYHLNIEKVYRCESSNYTFQFNFFLRKKTANTTELKGNVTFFKPFDDTIKLDVNVASWGLTGGWKPNSIVYISKNACSSSKHVLGKIWFSLFKGFSMPTSVCPIPAGTYMTSGIDVKELEDHNFPKVYFYGKYKAVFKMKNEENKILSCTVIEINLTRPWEKPI
ncbi:uncharacterized protein LOC132942303 [Metopolophium dirhodum]|uniref:uncharacterized protein LOC132942303 n=1 Tax=Metopolophium dirhodum TaxID=44670 RepID=UPI00298F8D4A|nr:uncharacterized protein LOC132942303 [Metopolophium dirhodum]